MEIKVEYKDANGQIHNQKHNLTRIAFAKHLAVAGQGYAPRLRKILRTVGMLLHYSYYMKDSEMRKNKFSQPPAKLSDPTEKSQFSNLAGKAIADFLSKQIDNSRFTVNYEAAMRINKLPIIGERPDLIAFQNNSMFSIEAKGYSGSYGDMNAHKLQSQSGGIPVNFSIASVSYNLYKGIRCKYYDPINEKVEFDNELFEMVTKKYYQGLLEYLDEEYFTYELIEVQDEKFYEIDLFSKKIFELLYTEMPLSWIWEIGRCYRPKLILPGKIESYAKKGLSKDDNAFNLEDKQQNDLYIDNDRVGLKIRYVNGI